MIFNKGDRVLIRVEKSRLTIVSPESTKGSFIETKITWICGEECCVGIVLEGTERFPCKDYILPAKEKCEKCI